LENPTARVWLSFSSLVESDEISVFGGSEMMISIKIKVFYMFEYWEFKFTNPNPQKYLN